MSSIDFPLSGLPSIRVAFNYMRYIKHHDAKKISELQALVSIHVLARKSFRVAQRNF